jgi:hypothetical protein
MDNEKKYYTLNTLVKRMKKMGIELELIGNYPWIYLRKVNGNTVKEKFYANHGFTVAFLPTKPEDKLELTDIGEVFKVIRKYK